MGCGQERKKNYHCEFVGIIKHDDSTYSLDFKSDEINIWQEGDHSMLIIDVNDILIGKKLSYVTLPDEGVIRFTTRITDESSDYKKALLQLVKDDYVKISEPSGELRLKRENRPVIMLSNGVGIAGVRSLIKQYMSDHSSIPEMIQMNVDAKSNIYKDEFDQYRANESNFQSYYLSHRTAYYGMLYHELKMISKRHALKPIFYIVGSDSFVDENVSYLKDLEFDAEDINLGGKQTDSCCRD